jgi:hypothetical protein
LTASSLSIIICRRFLRVSSALSIMSFPFSTLVPLPNLAACLSCSFIKAPLFIHTCSSSRFDSDHDLGLDGHIFLIADAQFLALQRPLFSLYVLLSTRQCLSSAVGCIGSSHIKLRSGLSVRSKGFILVQYPGTGRLMSSATCELFIG